MNLAEKLLSVFSEDYGMGKKIKREKLNKNDSPYNDNQVYYRETWEYKGVTYHALIHGTYDDTSVLELGGKRYREDDDEDMAEFKKEIESRAKEKQEKEKDKK